jgi:hypothetical protein
MSASALLAQLTAAGCRVSLRPDGRVSLRPPPPPDLLAEARQHRDELARLVAATTSASAEAPNADAAAPAAKAPKRPRLTRPGVCPSDPPAPVVDPESTRILVICELAGAAPHLGPDGRLTLGHPQRVSDDMRAAATLHQGDMEAILEYRALLERLFPVSAEPPPRPTNGDTNAI